MIFFVSEINENNYVQFLPASGAPGVNVTQNFFLRHQNKLVCLFLESFSILYPISEYPLQNVPRKNTQAYFANISE
jgi:hypothetical protein